LDSNIGVDGENAIAEGLKRITRLEELDLHDDNDFRDKQGATAIAKALKFNSTLQGLSLHWNNFRNGGATTITH
jgi:Ran GTPase-activating protein (RanGAP) involved in mRNA processing and transport